MNDDNRLNTKYADNDRHRCARAPERIAFSCIFFHLCSALIQVRLPMTSSESALNVEYQGEEPAHSKRIWAT